MDRESGTHVWLVASYQSRTCVLEKRENTGPRWSVERESAGGSDGNTMRPDHCSGPDGRPSWFIDLRIWEREAYTPWPVSQQSVDRCAESEGHRVATNVNNVI
jgi:hypothetical protein